MSEVYLTFDDGPNKGTGDVLDALRERGAKATFFLNLLRKADRTAQWRLVQRMIAEGHSLANHGVDHDPMTKKGYQSSTTAAVKKDFTDNAEVLDQMLASAGIPARGMNLARLPGDGRFQQSYVEMIVREVKLPHVGWDMEFSRTGLMSHVANSNWQGLTGVSATRKDMPKHQEVLLLHDLHWSGHKVLLASLIAKLQEKFDVRSMASLTPNLKCVTYSGQ